MGGCRRDTACVGRNLRRQAAPQQPHNLFLPLTLRRQQHTRVHGGKHGKKESILEKEIRFSGFKVRRARDEGLQERQAQVRPQRRYGQEQKAGNRDRSLRGPRRGRKGAPGPRKEGCEEKICEEKQRKEKVSRPQESYEEIF